MWIQDLEDYASRDPYPFSKCSEGVCGETSTPNPSFNYTAEVNHNIYIPERVNEVKSMKVKSVEIPCTFYNVSSALGNNSFKIINNTVAFDSSNNENVNVATEDDVTLQNSVTKCDFHRCCRRQWKQQFDVLRGYYCDS